MIFINNIKLISGIRTLPRGSITYALGCFLVLFGFSAFAQGSDQIENQCENFGWRGEPCITSEDCPPSGAANLCVNNTCQVPCQSSSGEQQSYLCSLGETCIEGMTGYGPAYYCQPSSFVMDLNLLDSCIMYFVKGLRPDLSGSDPCSVETNLNQLLDQTGEGIFNIFDVDGCVQAFLDAEPCDPDNQSCPNGQVFCANDDSCGEGLYCNANLHRCERECGFISNRQENEIETLERKCGGRLKVCNYERGKCKDIENLNAMTCQIDADCPAGAYCFMGVCQPKCYRSVDCPDSNWYCSNTNTCLPKPAVQHDGSDEPFNPKDYMLQFAQKSLTLDPINDEVSIPLLIMSLRTKKQVFDDPQVVFGYRMEVKYGKKQDDKCFKDPAQWSDAEREDCLIDDTEEFVTMLNPFGTVYATGDPTVDIRLNSAAVDRLNPGLYQANISIIFNNGSMDTATVTFRKTSPSGEYYGRLSVYVDGPDNLLGNTNLGMRLYVDPEPNNRREWDSLLEDENLDGDKDFIDITTGYAVSGTIHANESMIFDLPQALNKRQNEIPVKGIYAPGLGRMRLIGVIDIDEDHCRSENGECHPNNPSELTSQNVFKRKIRRILEFIGPYDSQQRQFHGMYRETISGLAPWDITLDGGFRLNQIGQNETPLFNPIPLLSEAASDPVGFVDLDSILEGEIEDDIAQYCDEAQSAKFANQAAFYSYFANYDNQDDRSGSGKIFPNLVSFGGLVGDALNGLNDNNGAVLTINDFLRGQIFFCSDSNIENCVDERKARCGLALYQKAILSGWIDLSTLGRTPCDCEELDEHGNCEIQNLVTERYTLFCSSVDIPEDCQIPASQNPALVLLQEHNRFYKEIAQTLSYEAGNELSDAFFVLYRTGMFDPLDQDAAFNYKRDKLVQALRRYNQLRDVVFSAKSTAIFYRWPMRAFKMMGNSWIKQMHTLQEDRLSTLYDLLDLKRRILLDSDEKDYVFMQHLLHEEYLTQVFLITLQKAWQGENFAYTGTGEKMLETGGWLLAKANESRNPLGLHPNRVYFENSNLNLTNWQNYRERLIPQMGGSGLVAEAEAAINRAVTNMQGALRDRDTFENSILTTKHQVEQTIDQLCGSADPLPAACDIDREERAIQKNCTGPDCDFEYQCNTDECENVVQVFNDNTGEASKEVACKLESEVYYLDLGQTTRTCSRGQMGSLQQEKILLDLQRKQIFRKVNALLRQIASQQTFIKETREAHADLIDYYEEFGKQMASIQQSINNAEFAFGLAQAAAKAIDCWIIVGVAAGTNCPQKIAMSLVIEAAERAKNAIVAQMIESKAGLQRAKEIYYTDYTHQAELRRQRMTLDSLVTSVENYVSEYETVTQQLFNLDMRIKDTFYLAKQAAARYNESLENLVDRLVGRESGNVLTKNQFVKESNRKFQEVLLETYRMAAAFVHRYNWHDKKEAIMNRVFRMMTVQDVKNFITYLNKAERDYCGADGLDCDYVHNPEVLRVSLRDELFPTLRDIVDAKTGKVLTKGMQFHNIITSSTFMKRRLRPGGLQEQIELPFAIWLNDQGVANGAQKRFMINPNDCNHIIVSKEGGGQAGTIAVNVIGTRLSSTLKYELWRGNTDYVRSCDSEVVTPPGGGGPINVYPINTYLVGYAPQSQEAQQNDPPTFITHSAEMSACKNNLQLETGEYNGTSCFRYFARDRSLSAVDWKLVIPRLEDEGGNQWIIGDGLAESEKPIIEDIILYFRHSGRPITR